MYNCAGDDLLPPPQVTGTPELVREEEDGGRRRAFPRAWRLKIKAGS